MSLSRAAKTEAIIESDIDDLFFDGYYWIRYVFRLWKTRHYKPLTYEQLAEKVNSPDLTFIAKNGIGEILTEEKKYHEAITYFLAILNNYQVGAKQIIKDVHPFRQYFEDLEVGETTITPTHTVTEEDIVNFANVSGDKFYAHLQPESLDGTIFKRTVAHGYFILSKAAGLFVDPAKGPVLLNYGIDECRFTRPIYPGMTIGVRFTCKEKISFTSIFC
jgi:acyl dehydratase